jgi:hypothetical protein
MLTVRPELFPEIRGTTDSELMFHLALTFGLAGDPIGALERMAGFVEALGARAGVPEPLQMTVGSPTESACTPRATPAARRSTRCTTAQTWTHCDSCIRPRSGSHTSAPKRGPWSPNTRRATRAVARGPGGVGPDGGERPGRPDPVHATATGVDQRMRRHATRFEDVRVSRLPVPALRMRRCDRSVPAVRGRPRSGRRRTGAGRPLG